MSDINFDVNDALPDHTVLSGELVVPDEPIPIKAIVNGKKVVVGHGTVDVSTGRFSGELEEGNAHADILRDKIKRQSIVNAQLYSISLVEEANPKYGSFPIVRLDKE